MKDHRLIKASTDQLLELEKLAKAGVVKWNSGNGAYFLSHGAMRAFGLKEGQKLPENHFFENFVDPDDFEELAKNIADAEGQGKDINTTFRLKDSGNIDRHFRIISRIADQQDDSNWRSAVLIDITDQRKSERQLKLTVEELERSNKDLEQFAYVASHDLQEPLRKIVAFGELLQDAIDEGDHENVRLYISTVKNATQRMQKLISDLLIYSRASLLGLDFDEIDLTKVLEAVLESHSQIISETQAKIKLEQLPTIEGHETRIFQLFHNLISNALKFKSPERDLEIKISAQEISILTGEKNKETTQGFEICVEDNGIGFKDIYAKKIFTIFQRLHGRKTYEGTGIGLALVKKVVDLHQGEIKAEGKPEAGARFIIKLPFKQSKAWKRTLLEMTP